jgi:hypothetical protein
VVIPRIGGILLIDRHRAKRFPRILVDQGALNVRQPAFDEDADRSQEKAKQNAFIGITAFVVCDASGNRRTGSGGGYNRQANQNGRIHSVKLPLIIHERLIDTMLDLTYPALYPTNLVPPINSRDELIDEKNCHTFSEVPSLYS